MLAVRDALPQTWVTALRDGTVVPTDERCLPPGLLDIKGPRQQIAIQHARTLRFKLQHSF